MSDERDEVNPLIFSVSLGSFKQARGIIPWQEGDEPAEVSIRRSRGDYADELAALRTQLAAALDRIAALEARLGYQEAGK